MPPPQPPDSSIIASAPVEPNEIAARAVAEEDLRYPELINELASALEEATAELAQLKGKQTVDDVKATLLAPYTNRVFRFVVGYCSIVGVMLLLAAWKSVTGFELSDAILGIIAGSTAVSVIGLIGMVITGLFGISRPAP